MVRSVHQWPVRPSSFVPMSEWGINSLTWHLCQVVKKFMTSFLHTKWQQQWNISIHNKLYQIQPTLGEWRPAFRKSRREQVVLSRLRIGHTRLTHSFILKPEPQPLCLTCQTTCMVKHILIECRAFAVIRKYFFKVNSLVWKHQYRWRSVLLVSDRVVQKNITN